MQKITSLLFSSILIFYQFTHAQSIAWQRNQSLGQGINLSGFENYKNGTPQINYMDYFPIASLPQKKNDLQLIAALGFNSVRLPVSFDHWEDGLPPYTIDSISYFTAIDSIIQWCDNYNLKLIIDYHNGSLANGNALNELPRTTQLWQQIAQRLAYADPNNVLFEIYNEPYNITNNDWAICADSLVHAIRMYDTQKTIVLGGINYYSITALTNLVAPADTNLIYTFHFYVPLLFTYQGAAWIGDAVSTIGIPYPYNSNTMPPLNPLAIGTWGQNGYTAYPSIGNDSALISQLLAAKNFEVQNNVPVMCGEWGSYGAYADDTSRCRYASVIKHTLDSLSIPNLMWEWDQGFSFFNGTASSGNIIPCFHSIFNFQQSGFFPPVSLDGVSIFPNPIQDFLTIQFSNKEQIAECKIKMYDIYGRIVLSQQMTTSNLPTGQAGNKIQTKNLAPGIYFIELFSDKVRMIKKIVKSSFH